MHCKSAGYRSTGQGKRRLYKCLVCGRKFTPDSPFLGMRNDPEIVAQCLDLYNSGLSFRSIAQHLKRTRGIKISHSSIYRWLRKYSKILKPYVDTFKVDGQDSKLGADEMMIQVSGEWMWAWHVISKEKRFILSNIVSPTRDMDTTKELFRDARRKIDGLPLQITTDGMKAYPQAIKSAFPLRRYPHVEHYVAPAITHYKQNNLIERHHGSVRARTKVMRGFGSLESALDIINLWHVHFNFLRPHMSLGGKTPAEAAGLGKHDLKSMIEEAYHGKRRHS